MSTIPRKPGAPYGLPAVSAGDRASTRNPGPLGPGGFKRRSRVNRNRNSWSIERRTTIRWRARPAGPKRARPRDVGPVSKRVRYEIPSKPLPRNAADQRRGVS